MLKLRIIGKKTDVDKFIKSLQSNCRILRRSEDIYDTPTEFVRVYLNIEELEQVVGKTRIDKEEER